MYPKEEEKRVIVIVCGNCKYWEDRKCLAPRPMWVEQDSPIINENSMNAMECDLYYIPPSAR